MDQAKNEEIDLFSVIKTIWEGKWKITLFILIPFIISVYNHVSTPNSFQVTTYLQGNQGLYYKFGYLNNILKMEPSYTEKDAYEKIFINNNKINDTNKIFEVDASRIFTMLVNEFNDYEEMITILSENDYVKDKIKNFDEKEKRTALFGFAKKFSIKILDNNPELLFKNNNSELHFNWHKVSEGSLLFDKALGLTLINVQKSLLTEIDNIAKSIDLENQRKIASLKVKLNSTLTLNDLMNVKKKRYLLEQSKIAKELGIEKNRLNITSNVSISENAEPQRYNQEFNVKDSYYPYYLRGFKAINKEIELIENRSENENKLMSEGYLALKHALILVEKDNRSKYLREAMKTLENDNISKWVSYNFELAEVQNIKNTHLHILLSIILGGILGMFYVLLIKAFKNRKAY